MLQIQWQRQVPRGSRGLARTALLQSGHNRWSKIRHDKAKVDVGVIVIVLMLIIEAGVTRQRAAITQELQQASKGICPQKLSELSRQLLDLTRTITADWQQS